MTLPLITLNSAVKVSTNTKCVLEQNGEGPLEMYRRVLNENVNFTSNKTGFRTNNNSVSTYEQVKKSLSYFYPKRIVESDGNHTQLPSL